MIAIIDYDAGNIRSVEMHLLRLEKKLSSPEIPKFYCRQKSNIAGGWSFWGCNGKLDAYGLVNVIHQIVEKKIPFLGICLGLQLCLKAVMKHRV